MKKNKKSNTTSCGLSSYPDDGLPNGAGNYPDSADDTNNLEVGMKGISVGVPFRGPGKKNGSISRNPFQDDEFMLDGPDSLDAALDQNRDYDRLNNLDWLGDFKIDKSRLPVNPVDTVARELSNQWGNKVHEPGGFIGEYMFNPVRLSSSGIDPNYVRNRKQELSNQEVMDIIRVETSRVAKGVSRKLVYNDLKIKLGSRFGEFKKEISDSLPKSSKEKLKRGNYQCPKCSGECRCVKGIFSHDETVERIHDRYRYSNKEIKTIDRESEKKKNYIGKTVLAGLITNDQGEWLLNSGKSLPDIKRVVNDHLGAVKRGNYNNRLEETYTRPEYRDVINSENTKEIHKLLKFARKEMTEGVAGSDLDSIIRANFSSSIIKVASGVLKSIRDKHEGLSGFLYVDPLAYGSEVRDCERGALRHRANSIKYAMAMDKCSGCVFNNCGSCTKYKKELINKKTFVAEDLNLFKRGIFASLKKSGSEQINDLFLDSSSSVMTKLANPFSDIEFGEEYFVDSDIKPFGERDVETLPGFSKFEL